jgi:putative ABC transport system permease protein
LAFHRTRTTLAAGVLFLALTVATGFGHGLRSIMRDLDHWYQQTIVADFLVRAAMPDTAFSLTAAMPEALAAEIADDENIAAVDMISFLPCSSNGRPLLVLARTFSSKERLPLDLQQGKAAEVLPAMFRGEAVLGTALAQELDLAPLGTLTLDTILGPKDIAIAGMASEFAAGGTALYLEWEAAKRLLHVPGVHCFLVSARPGKTTEAAAALKAFCKERRLLLQTNADLRVQVERLLSRVTGLLWGLLALAFMVAALGIVNTLAMDVRAQSREFAVFDVLGMQRRQIRKVILAHALVLGGLCLIPGTLAGIVVASVIHIVGNGLSNPSVLVQFDGVVVSGCCILALATACLAALAPAWQAGRRNITEGILN